MVLMFVGQGGKLNNTVKKRYYLVKNMEWLLELLSYHRAWGNKIRNNPSNVLWKAGQKESGASVRVTSK